VTAARGAAHVHADLQVQVGEVSAQLIGEGTSLRLVTDDAGGFAAALRNTAPAVDSLGTRHSLATLGRLLDDASVCVELVGERGTVASVGHDQRSPLVQLLTGVGHLRLGSVRVVVPTLIRAFRRSRQAD
jgi:hypothetical protein